MPSMRQKRRKVDPRKLARLKHRRDLVEARAIGGRVRALRESQALVLAPSRALERVPAPDKFPRGVYLTLAEARSALAEEHQREQGGSGGIATGLAIGLGAVAILGFGVVICYLLFRRRDGEGQATAPVLTGAPQIIHREIIREVLPERVPLERARRRSPSYHADPDDEDYEEPAARRVSNEARARSFYLPTLADSRSEAVRIATATDRPCRATVRVVAPSGGFIAVAYSPSELNVPGLDAIPVGDTLIMPVGDVQEMRLSPRQALYAKGSVPGVVVSVLTAETPSDG